MTDRARRLDVGFPARRRDRRISANDREAQARVHRQLAAAVARRDDDLTDQARAEPAALLILAPLAVLDIGPLRMTGHVGDALCGACVWETLGILRAAASARQVLTRGEFVRDRSTG